MNKFKLLNVQLTKCLIVNCAEMYFFVVVFEKFNFFLGVADVLCASFLKQEIHGRAYCFAHVRNNNKGFVDWFLLIFLS